MSIPNPSTTDWIALWDLNGGVKLDYKGSWTAGSYTDGDVVVYQGTTYMCVRPTSAAPVPWPLASGSASYGTSPPANPVDGQIWMLPLDTGVVWQFRYNATSASAYKWEFIGGSGWYMYGTPNAVLNTLTQVGATGYYYETGNVNPVPRAGDYIVNGFMTFDANGVAGQPSLVGFAGVTVFEIVANTHIDTTVNSRGTPTGVWKLSGVSAGAKVGVAGAGTGPGSHIVRFWATTVAPVRVA